MNEANGHLDPTLLLAYHENELDESERNRVESHLEHCGACRAEFELAREIAAVPVGASMGKRSEELKSAFAARLRDRRGSEAEAKPTSAKKVVSPRPRRSHWLAGGLLAASLAVFAIGIYQLRGPSTPNDLGRTVRTGSKETSLSLQVRRTAPGAWELACRVESNLKDPRVVISTAKGKIALTRAFPGDRLSITRADMVTQAGDSILFVQIVARDALGNPVRSKPQLLPQ